MKNLRKKKDFLRDWLIWLTLLSGICETVLGLACILHTPKKNDLLETTVMKSIPTVLLYSLLIATRCKILVSQLTKVKRILQIMLIVLAMFNLLWSASSGQIVNGPIRVLSLAIAVSYMALAVIFASVFCDW